MISVCSGRLVLSIYFRYSKLNRQYQYNTIYDLDSVSSDVLDLQSFLFPSCQCEEDKGKYLSVLDVLRVIKGQDGLGYNGRIRSEVSRKKLVDQGSSPSIHAWIIHTHPCHNI